MTPRRCANGVSQGEAYSYTTWGLQGVDQGSNRKLHACCCATVPCGIYVSCCPGTTVNVCLIYNRHADSMRRNMFVSKTWRANVWHNACWVICGFLWAKSEKTVRA